MEETGPALTQDRKVEIRRKSAGNRPPKNAGRRFADFDH
jgi:hypothetical protein